MGAPQLPVPTSWYAEAGAKQGVLASGYAFIAELYGTTVARAGAQLDESKASIDKSMPAPKAPKPWQCTDVPALKDLAQKNRSCLAYDNSKGYTYVDGECIPSDYSGCIDTYNKFKDIDLCTQSTFLTCVPTSFGHKSKKCHKRRNNS